MMTDQQREAAARHFQVWVEGWCATGGSSPARLVAEVDATSFKEACAMAARQAGWKTAPGEEFDPDRLTFWGSRLFDNEEDARRAFG